jgi:hypothetical protein
VWQRGPWLLVDRVTGHVVALKLPDYDPAVSQVSWFRDYAAYCGVTSSGKSLYAVVAQVAARKPVLAKKMSAFDPESHPDPACAPAEWQREPLRIRRVSTSFPVRRCWSRTRETSRRRLRRLRKASRNSKPASQQVSESASQRKTCVSAARQMQVLR